MSYLEPWEEKTDSERSDQLKRFVYQAAEDRRVDSLPHVLKPLPSKQTVMGRGSPHQTGDLTSYDILIRGPLYYFASHIIDIAPPRSSARHTSTHRRSHHFLPRGQRLGNERWNHLSV